MCQDIYLDIKIDVRNRQKDSGAPEKRNLGPKGNARAIHVWLVLWKASRAIEHNAIKSVAGLDLGLSDFAVLEALFHKGPQPVNVIGKKVLLTSGSITTAVDRLESRKLLRRTSDPRDGRSRIVELTDSGRRLIDRVFEKHTQDMEQTMAVL